MNHIKIIISHLQANAINSDNSYQRLIPLPDDTVLDRSKVKQSADNNFKFDENSRKFSKRVENTVVKEKLLVGSNFSFSHSVSKGLFPRGVKRCRCVGMG